MKMCQNMTKFDENQWFWVDKYDSGVKNDFRCQKTCFYDDLGDKNGKFEKINIF